MTGRGGGYDQGFQDGVAAMRMLVAAWHRTAARSARRILDDVPRIKLSDEARQQARWAAAHHDANAAHIDRMRPIPSGGETEAGDAGKD